MKCFLHAKIHKAYVTEANKDYVGSITIDKNLLDLVGISVWEKVLISNNSNWNRLETYVIAWESWEICVNWAASYLFNKGDEIIIMAYEWSDKVVVPNVILVDNKNNFVEYLVEKANWLN